MSPRTNAKIFFERGNKFTGCIEDDQEEESGCDETQPNPILSESSTTLWKFKVEP